jgi:CHRD domain/Secretion system C-terminal sorting domain/Ig-like domain CHU_C associated
MKKYLYTLALFLLSVSFFGQATTVTFETETVGSTSFTNNGQVFNVTTQTPSQTFAVSNYTGAGWNGTAPDDQLLDNSFSANYVPVQFTVSSAGQVAFKLKSIYIFLAEDAIMSGTGNVTITGKLSGNTVFTAVATSDFNTSVANNGYTFFNLASYGGADNSNKLIDEYVIATSGTFYYAGLDAMTWQKKPAISTTGTPTAFSSCVGTASTSQSFKVSGTDLTANITVTAPTGFEVSTTAGSGYGASLSLTPVSGTVASTTVYARLASTATGTPSGNIACTTTDATTQNVAVSGTVNALPATPTITAGGPTSFCAGGSVTLTSSSTTGNIWSTGATTPSISVSAAGTYTVSVTSGGCTSATSAGTTVTITTPLGASPGNVDISWTGAVGNDWNNACNWSPSWVPDMTNGNVIINSGVNNPNITATVPDVKAIIIANRTLVVSSGGVLNIRGNGVVDNGIEINTNATVSNSGTINIESATHTAILASIYLRNGGCTLANTGAILINSTDAGIGVGFSSGATVNNTATGIITIANGTGVEVALATDVLNFNNYGVINYNGLVDGLSLQGATNFSNYGTINLNSGTGITNASPASIKNLICGKILMASGNYTNGGTTTNSGLISMPNAYDFTNTGTFTNDGIVKANSISAITNNRISLTNACTMMAIGATNDYTVDGIFTDAAATTSAGTYTLASNTFVPIGILPTGSQTLYAKYSRASCLFIVPFTYSNSTTPTGTATQSFCGTATVTNLTATGTGIQWYAASSGGLPLATTTALVSGTHYYASQTISGCESASRFDVMVTLNPLPIVSAGANQTVCSGAMTMLTATCDLLTVATTLMGASEVPANASIATGAVSGTFNKATNQLVLKVSFNGLAANASASHIHKAVVGVNGPVQIGFTGVPAATSGSFTYTGTLTATQATDLLAGLYYVNVHNASFPGGEIRGQLSTACVADTFTWDNGAGSGQTVMVNPTITTTYTVTASNSVTGCSTTSPTTITVNTIDNTVAQASGTLTANQAGATYQWYECPSTLLTGETNQTYTPTATGDYKVDVTIGGCTLTSACTTVTVITLGTKGFELDSNFKISPNPATSSVIIETQKLDNASVEVSDISGRKLFSQKLNNVSNNINIGNWASGTYFFKVSAKQGSAISKVVKN